jgi:hypothetical protein
MRAHASNWTFPFVTRSERRLRNASLSFLSRNISLPSIPRAITCCRTSGTSNLAVLGMGRVYVRQSRSSTITYKTNQRPLRPLYMGGQIFETAVLAEIVKTFRNRGEDPRVYFWRTSAGVEVDILIDLGMKLIPIEVKLSATPSPSMANGILSFRKDFGKKSPNGYLIHPGDILLPLGENVIAVPFCAL